MPLLLSPRWLFLALAAVPLVLLYVLKTRRRTVRVSSSALFAQAQREAKARDPWKRLVPEIPLFLQLVALGALAFAASRPVSRSAALDADAIVVVIDRSASMATRVPSIAGEARDATPTRATRAKTLALAQIDALGVGAEAAVISAGRDARVAQPLSNDTRGARDLIAAMPDGPSGIGMLVEGDLQSSLDVARDLLRARGGRRRVVLVTDGALAHTPTWVDEEGGSTLDVVSVDVPALPASREGNIGITRVDARRGATSTATDHVDVGVVLVAYGAPADGRERFVTLRRIDRATALDAQRVTVSATGRASVTLGFSPAADGSDELATLVVELSPNDALVADDQAQLVVPPPRTMPVVLASLGAGGATWLSRALSADPGVKLSTIPLDRLASAAIDPWSLVIVADACPATVAGAGDLVIVNPPPGRCVGRTIGAAVSGAALPPITSWSSLDARLRWVDLEGVKLGRALPIAPLDGDAARGAETLGPASLVRAEGMSLVADASTLDRTVTIWGFDPADGDLARRAAFVLLVRDAVDVARARRDAAWAPSTRAGLAARVVAAPGAIEVVARAIGRQGIGDVVARAPVIEGVALVEGVDRPGPFILEGAATRAPLTASLLSESESDVTRAVEPLHRHVDAVVSTNRVSSPEGKSGDVGARGKRDLGWLVALTATLLLCIDALWLGRRGARAVARLTRQGTSTRGA